MKRALYIARAGLPIDATGLRIFSIGSLLEKMDYRIHYICDRRVDAAVENSGYETVQDDDEGFLLAHDEIHFRIGNKVYSYLPSFVKGKWNALKEIVEICTASRSFKRVKKICRFEQPDLIILYNDAGGLTKKLIPFCKKQNIKLLADVTEWYEKRRSASVAERLVISFTDRRIRFVDKKLDGVIAISPFFHDYYNNQGVKCILIPPLMEIDDRKIERDDNPKNLIRFVYAGSPGSKDIVIPFVRSIVKANMEKINFRLDLVGIDYQYLAENGCPHVSENTGVFAYGRLSHPETVEIVKQADFGILFRHNQRYAKAGFSTKFAECMSLGVAMVCNRIGGTDRFISDGVDGFVLEEANEQAFDSFLQKLLPIDGEKIASLKANAYLKATKIFDLRNYERMLHDFLGELRESNDSKVER